METKAGLSKEEGLVVEKLAQLGAVSLKHLALICCQGDAKKTYDVLAGLKKKGWILLRDAPNDAREKYAVLGKKGITHAYPDIKRAANYSPYAKRNRAERILARTDVCFQLLQAGVPEHSILNREQLLARLELKPAQTIAIWGIQIDDKLYPVYLRQKRVRSQMLYSIQRLSKRQAEGHLVVYKDEALLKQDRIVFMEAMPASLCWLINLAEPAELQAVIRHLAAPTAWMRELWANLLPLYPDSYVQETEPTVPFCYTWSNNGKMFFLGDLACSNIGVASLARSVNRAYLEALWGVSGVILRVLSTNQARIWASAMNYPEWVYFAVQGAPKEERLQTCRDKRLVCITPSIGGGK